MTCLVGEQPGFPSESFYRDLSDRFGAPLLVFDQDRLRTQVDALQSALPGVSLFYAIKALPAPEVLQVLDGCGVGFDVASAGEADLLADMRVSGRRTIHTHPIKKDQEIRAALRFGATTFVVDSLLELKKLIPYRHRVGVLLRVSFRSADARVDLSRKFGCAEEDVLDIVAGAQALGIHVKGLSFHVGSQCGTPDQHVQAIARCAELMQGTTQALNARVGGRSVAPMSVLDIGGGFPADYELQGVDIEQYCAPIRAALEQLPSEWTVYAEPGRFLVASAVTGVFSVVGVAQRGGQPWYFLDDGVYGSFSGQIFDHVQYPLQVFRSGPETPSMLAGPTCDSIDMVRENLMLPVLEEGDLVVGHRMGAYSAATRTHFNSLPAARFVTIAGGQPVLDGTVPAKDTVVDLSARRSIG